MIVCRQSSATPQVAPGLLVALAVAVRVEGLAVVLLEISPGGRVVEEREGGVSTNSFVSLFRRACSSWSVADSASNSPRYNDMGAKESASIGPDELCRNGNATRPYCAKNKLVASQA
jgi:hypothetical protein